MNKLVSAMLMAFVVLGSSSVALAVEGDAAQGKKKSASCAGCHGADGNSMMPNFPKLAGQGAKYLAKQMHDFKTGARDNAIMKGQVASLTDQDIADIAAYYASLTMSGGEAKKEFVDLGQKIYAGGNTETGVAACAACHGANGKGMAAAGFPALAGQHAAYIEAQLKAFRAAGRDDLEGDRRTNDSEDPSQTGMMQDVAKRMSDKEIQAVASYISGLY